MQIVMLLIVFAGLVHAGVQAYRRRRLRAPAEAVPPKLTLAFTINVQVGAPTELGQVPRGRRRIIPILGGTFEGPGIRGKVVPGGADWQIVRADGLAELDTRYLLQTDSGQLIYIQNAGIRHAPPDVTKKLLAGEAVDPSQVYFKTDSDVRDVGAGTPVADQIDLRGNRRTQAFGCGDSRLEGRLARNEREIRRQRERDVPISWARYHRASTRADQLAGT